MSANLPSLTFREVVCIDQRTGITGVEDYRAKT